MCGCFASLMVLGKCSKISYTFSQEEMVNFLCGATKFDISMELVKTTWGDDGAKKFKMFIFTN